MSNRIALAPIRDSSLNISTPKKSPLKSPRNVQRRYSPSLVLLTPNGSQKSGRSHHHHHHHHHQHQNNPIHLDLDLDIHKNHASQQITPKNLGDHVFNDQHLTPNSTSTSPPSLSASPERIDKNAAASLAATKLKLKLQLAIYKLQKQGLFLPKKANVPKSFITTSININLKSLQNSASSSSTTKIRASSFPSSATAGITKRKKPSLSATAYDKNLLLFRNSQKLRLFSIKKQSKFYTERKSIPLEPGAHSSSSSSSSASSGGAGSANLNASATSAKTSSLNVNASVRLSAAANASAAASSTAATAAPARAHQSFPPHATSPSRATAKSTTTASFQSSKLPALTFPNKQPQSNASQTPVSASKLRQLPPINKILKTPLKASSRDLVNPYLPEGKRYKPYNNTDETIDEDDDGPIKESTSNSIRVGKDLLSSSPIQGGNGFGTPNSFSVAKSLLQLGSGFYN